MMLRSSFPLLLDHFPLGFAGSSTFNQGAGDSFGRSSKNATYDYVRIGGGTARLAVVMRLVENTSYTIAVVNTRGFYKIENGNQSVKASRMSLSVSRVMQLCSSVLIDIGVRGCRETYLVFDA